MHTINVKTATRESAEQFKTDKFQRYCVIDDNELAVLAGSRHGG